jgi:hypothetical protein
MQKKDNMPDIVYLGLLGINSKATAYVYLAITVFIGLASIYFGLSKPVYFLGIFMFVASFWYYYCINWVEKHSNWN